MYTQRQFGSSVSRKPPQSTRGMPDSRHGKRDSRGGSNVSVRNSGSSSTPQQKKPEVQRKPEPERQGKKENEYQAKKTSEVDESSTTEGLFVEADVVGFDDAAAVDVQFTGDQTNVNENAGNPQVDPLSGKQPKAEDQRQFEYRGQGYENMRQEYQGGEQGYRGDRSFNRDNRKEPAMKTPRGNRQDHGLQGNQQNPNNDDTGLDDLNNFGILNLNGKKYVNIESLILPNEKKHSGRSRLFVANIGNTVTEQDLKDLFSKFGEPSELYVNKEKSFGFVRLDYKVNAEIARNALDGYLYKGRYLKVKFAAHQSAIEIHGIDRFTSNESLEAAFSQFGMVERATVICDERGKSKGYAVVEFAFKKSAQLALRKINDGLFVLGRVPKPVYAKPFTQTEEEGIHESDLERIPGIAKDREYKSRFVLPESPEFALAKRWRDLQDHESSQKDSLEKQLEEDRQKLEIDIETAVHDQEAEYIRQELLQRQAALEEEIRRYDEMRNRESMMIRQGHQNFYKDSNNQGSDAARRQDDFIRKQQQELQRRQRNDDIMMGMQGGPANIGMAGLNPAAALAMAASGNPAASAAAANILQAIQGDQMGGGGQGMSRMPGPRGHMGMSPRGMMGPGGMPSRPSFDSRQGQGRGTMLAGGRRPGMHDMPPNNKRPRK